MHLKSESAKGKVKITVILNIIITVSEITGGIFSHSLALISDGIHNLSDVLSGILTLGAMRLSERENTKTFTFGFKRGEILAALFNSSLIIAVAIYLIFEAVSKFFHPETVKGLIMIYVALIGLVANWASVFLLHKPSQHSLNVKSAYLHLLGDALSSIGVVLGGILIFYYKIYWIDPLITLVVSAFILNEAFKIVKETVIIVMEGAPRNIGVEAVQEDVLSVDAVENLHHVHLWQLSDGAVLFEGHVLLKNDLPVSKAQVIRKQISELLHKKYGISHVTIQFEFDEHKGEGLIKKKF